MVDACLTFLKYAFQEKSYSKHDKCNIWFYIFKRAWPPLSEKRYQLMFCGRLFDMTRFRTHMHIFPPSIMHYLITSTSPISQSVTRVIISNDNVPGTYIYKSTYYFNHPTIAKIFIKKTLIMSRTQDSIYNFLYKTQSKHSWVNRKNRMNRVYK